MTGFSLKLIAACAMLLDHLGLFAQQTGILPQPYVQILREIGRIAWPLFAFCAAQGWRWSRDRSKYLSRLLTCAFFSAIPYAMAFFQASSEKPAIWFAPAAQILGMIAVAAAGVVGTRKDARLWPKVLAAALLPMIRCSVGPLRILQEEQSVLYTILYGLLVLDCLQRMQNNTFFRRENAWRWVLLGCIPLCYRFDYGLLGALSIAAFFFAQTPRARLVCGLAVAGALYLPGRWQYAFWAAIAAVLISFANDERGRQSQRWFYWFYPVHLVVFGLIRICILGV